MYKLGKIKEIIELETVELMESNSIPAGREDCGYEDKYLKGACSFNKQSLVNPEISYNDPDFKQPVVNLNRKRYTIFYNSYEHRFVVIDQLKARYTRMRKRIKSFCETIRKKRSNLNLFMITLTYREDEEWEANDIRDYMLRLRGLLGNNLLGYAWVAELTAKGKIHYHVLVYVLPGVYVPYSDKAGIWTKGMSNLVKAETQFYLLSYTAKAYQKNFLLFPKNIRVFSVWVSEEGLKARLKYLSLSYWKRQIVDFIGYDGLMMVIECRKEGHTWTFENSYVSASSVEAFRTMVDNNPPLELDNKTIEQRMEFVVNRR